MMTSEAPGDAYVWIWLPGAAEPVVAGRLEEEGDIFSFVYERAISSDRRRLRSIRQSFR